MVLIYPLIFFYLLLFVLVKVCILFIVFYNNNIPIYLYFLTFGISRVWLFLCNIILNFLFMFLNFHDS